MKAVINVKGTKMSVLTIHYNRDGEPTSVNTRDEKGRLDKTYADKSLEGNAADIYDGFLDLKTALEYPELEARIVEGNNRLIEHLDKMLEHENIELTNIAIEGMESKPDLPFDSQLSRKQHEYKLRQQRLFGLIDGVEEVKAFTEGYFLNVDDEADEAQSSH
ncbi:hypothetical protein FOH38_02165 [Lysinibacillus fusiformis]|nr:hypothetical protein FOH38_02165 [Lysinibacillus fusiformis]